MNHYKTIIVAVVICIGFVACKEKKPVLPNPLPIGIISYDTMTMIMTDCFLGEGAVKQIQAQHKNAIKHSNLFYDKIFSKYEVTYEQYKRSLSFYHEYPSIAEDMYDIAIQNLSVLESKIEKKEEEEN